MAIPNYAYLKMKMPGPQGVITVQAKAPQALACEQEGIRLASVAVAAAEMKDLRRAIQPDPAESAKTSGSGTFKSAEDTKAIPIDPEDPAKVVRIGATLDLK